MVIEYGSDKFSTNTSRLLLVPGVNTKTSSSSMISSLTGVKVKHAVELMVEFDVNPTLSSSMLKSPDYYSGINHKNTEC